MKVQSGITTLNRLSPRLTTVGHQCPTESFERSSLPQLGLYSPQPQDIWNDGRPWGIRNQPSQLVSETVDGKKTFSGFRWGWAEAANLEDWTPHFQDTTVDFTKLKEVHFYLEHFFPAGHGALVFEFEPGAVTGADGQSTDRMVYSIEARKKEGEDWTWKRGLKKTMGVVHQLMTFDDAKQWVTRRQGGSLETRRLDLTSEQKQALLETCMGEAVKDRTGEYYHSTRNSCYSGLLRTMNDALPDNDASLRSPLFLKLLMRPEAFLTGSYNTFMKRMGIYARENSQYYLPDAQLHPVKHAEGLEKVQGSGVLKSLGEQSWFAPTMRVAGTLAGAGLGKMLTDSLVGMAALGYVGYKAGAITGDHIEGNALRDVINA